MILIGITANGGVLRIRIGSELLRHVAASHPDFWKDGESGLDTPNIEVTDRQLFIEAIRVELMREGEDGSTLLTRALDTAMVRAVEHGCEGVKV